MLISFKNGQSGIILRIKILDSSKSDGSGLVGLTVSSQGLVISTIGDVESTPIAYRAANGDLETITTLGVYQQPSPGKCRFREVHSTFHRGVYEIQLSDARFAVAGAKSLLISISGALNAADSDALIPLTVFDPFSVNGGFDPWSAALPGSYAAGSAGARVGLLDASVSSRLAASTYTQPPLPSAVAAAVWDEPTAAHNVTGSYGMRVDAAISSRLAASAYTQPPLPSTVAAAVWDEPTAAHNVTGSYGMRVDAAISTRLAASAYTQPPLPSAVAAAVWDEPTAPHTVTGSFGTRVDAAISTRLAASAYTQPPLPSAVAAAVWDEPTAAHNVTGSFGTRVDAAISTRLAASAYTQPPLPSAVAAAVWDESASAHKSVGSFGAFVDTPVSSRLAASNYSPPPSQSTIAFAVWEEAAAQHTNLGSFGSLVDVAISSRSTYAGGPVQSVVSPVTVGVNNDKSDYTLAASGLDTVSVEPGINARQALSPILAALAGVIAGAETGAVRIQGANSSTVRISASTDANGNRSSVNLVLPA